MKFNYGNGMVDTKIMFWWRKSNFIFQPVCICYFCLSFNEYFPLSLILICFCSIFIFAEIFNTLSEFKKGIIEFEHPIVRGQNR